MTSSGSRWSRRRRWKCNAVESSRSAQRYQFGNHLGSASLELDEQGGLISYEEYHPYGSTSYQAGRSGAELSVKRYRYTGKERDEETGFTYHGARYYATWLGRWTSCDPSSRSNRDTNCYEYALGNPIRYLDENGRDPVLPNDHRTVEERNRDYRDPQAQAQIVEQERRREFEGSHTEGDAEQLRDKVPLLPFFLGGVAWAPSQGYGGSSPRLDWSQYVRTNQAPPAGAPVGLAALRQLNSGGSLAVANFSRNVAPGTSVENLTLQTVGAITATAGVLGQVERLAAQDAALAESFAQKALTAEAAAQKAATAGAVPGKFGPADVAFGLTRPDGKAGGLVEFAGEAVPGTRAPLGGATRELELGALRDASIARDTLNFARETLGKSGGRLRFNLAGFDVQSALKPGSPAYGSITSREFRGILQDADLLAKTSFYDAKGVDITQTILQLVGAK